MVGGDDEVAMEERLVLSIWLCAALEMVFLNNVRTIDGVSRVFHNILAGFLRLCDVGVGLRVF